jgi:hypothetical protein
MYRIFNPDYPECYVGSTQNFNDRKSSHSKNFNNKNRVAYSYKVYEFIRNNGGWDKWTMEQLEMFSCDTKEERLTREKELVKVHNSILNTNSPFQTTEELKQYKAKWIMNKRQNASDEWKENERSKKNKAREGKKDVLNANQRDKYATDIEYKKRQDNIARDYRERNPEKIKQISKAYYDKHAVQLRAKASAWGKQRITCECGKEMTKSSLSKHRKTNNHKKTMEELEKRV